MVCILPCSQVGFGFVKGREDLRAGAFLVFPQGESLLDSLFGAVQAPGCNGLADEGLLFRSELHFHDPRLARDDPARPCGGSLISRWRALAISVSTHSLCMVRWEG